MNDMLEDMLLDRRIASFIPNAVHWNQDGRISIITRKGLTILSPKPYSPPLKKITTIQEDPVSSKTTKTRSKQSDNADKKDKDSTKVKVEEQPISKIKQEDVGSVDLTENTSGEAGSTNRETSNDPKEAKKSMKPKASKVSKPAKKPIPKKKKPQKKQPRSETHMTISSSSNSAISQLSDLFIATSHQTTLLQILNVLFLALVDNEDVRITQNRSDFRTSLINHESSLVEMKWSSTGIDLIRAKPQSQQLSNRKRTGHGHGHGHGNGNDDSKTAVVPPSSSSDAKHGCLAAFVTDGMNACICRCSSGDSANSGITLLCNLGEEIVKFERMGFDNTRNGTIQWGTTTILNGDGDANANANSNDDDDDTEKERNPADWDIMITDVVKVPASPLWDPDVDERGYPKRRRIDIDNLLMRDEVKHFRVRSVGWLPEPTNVYSQLLSLDQFDHNHQNGAGNGNRSESEREREFEIERGSWRWYFV
ncbi:unnamed protein product [Ambrosiozyma monospora]|uniref:Unnamed protein product n=1 Tax=Ambrosiozyma monospora TaxID=43982 RepID=A0A9W6YVH5_AMBMO|nr:unnamed protein product [Ambrosiozyma monospora]